LVYKNQKPDNVAVKLARKRDEIAKNMDEASCVMKALLEDAIKLEEKNMLERVPRKDLVDRI
jgi:hypothetical protein